MKSFKDYLDDNEKTAEGNTMSTGTASAEALAMKLAQAYSGKSNAEMLKGILTEAEQSKRAGTLSNAEIDAFYQSFAPMLDSAQRKTLKMVVDRLKKI